jgi:hypothetical protein
MKCEGCDASKINTSKNRSNSSNVFNLPAKRNLKMLTVNCRSIKDKTSEFTAAVNSDVLSFILL